MAAEDPLLLCSATAACAVQADGPGSVPTICHRHNGTTACPVCLVAAVGNVVVCHNQMDPIGGCTSGVKCVGDVLSSVAPDSSSSSAALSTSSTRSVETIVGITIAAVVVIVVVISCSVHRRRAKRQRELRMSLQMSSGRSALYRTDFLMEHQPQHLLDGSEPHILERSASYRSNGILSPFGGSVRPMMPTSGDTILHYARSPKVPVGAPVGWWEMQPSPRHIDPPYSAAAFPGGIKSPHASSNSFQSDAMRGNRPKLPRPSSTKDLEDYVLHPGLRRSSASSHYVADPHGWPSHPHDFVSDMDFTSSDFDNMLVQKAAEGKLTPRRQPDGPSTATIVLT
ncbi:hypothetical protein H310_12722 [Aphanomyces invadans]|uniref:Uncharacterized protein n=1 Tax=Aphanomyces invadans TaxID=157072 RepID=A0A024TH10_9STRA|nr:hypothetical protein H310_12722 [Aphanomyces invadans]ETV93294.1 hypothetical protein H310_12722 [Aphanomyces invadans]RHY22823.1 hypothetical protein DYB32_009388 [Aphanomyces invadans]|eukprot:XP_008878129.1 hypothetical protein H310_12722 [Aphanomyces invadans]